MARDAMAVEGPLMINSNASGDDSVKLLCIQHLKGWSSLGADSLEVTPITGGISNMLVKVTPPAASALKPVAVKVFGSKTELLIDRDQEIRSLLHLNKYQIGPKVLAVFGNGRIEEFLNAKTLTPEEMADPKYVPAIAEKLRLFHRVGAAPGPDGVVPTKPTLWPTIYGWLDLASNLQFDHDPKKRAKYEQVDFASMRQEVDEIKAACDAVQSPVIFSHNDLLSGNILIMQDEASHTTERSDHGDLGGRMTFIDFEYSAPGFRGFDFGNHFNEYAGFDCNYSKYPGPDAQRLFFRHYLQAAHQEAGQDHAAADVRRQVDPDETTLERMEAEANVYALASHVYWGIWAIVQARYSPIDFDYLEYSSMRWEECRRRKAGFLAQARQCFGSE